MSNNYIVGFKPPDDQFKKMKGVYDACVKAGINVPDEVMEFFNDEPPDDSGVAVELDKHKAVKEYSAEMQDGFELDLIKLDPNIKLIRFYHSY